MIYTITFNPSMDYFVHLPMSFAEGSIMRSDKSYIRVGGKGINISATLAGVRVPSKTLTFLGGSIGNFIEKELSSIKNVELRKVQIEEENRINVKIRNTVESAINAEGPTVSAEHQEELLELLGDLKKGDYVVISGSYTKGVGTDLVYRIGELVKKVGAKLITDVPNLKFNDLEKIKPFLIKPNIEELAYIFEEEVNKENYREYIDKLIDAGVENVLLSIGAPGSYFASKDEKYRVSGPQIKVVSTVGCGDSMLAYTLSRLYVGDDKKKAILFGEAAGRVKAGSRELVDPADVVKMTKEIVVEEV